jgi:hypothetical protein
MKTSLQFLVLFGAATALAGCGDSETPGSGSAGTGGEVDGSSGTSAGGKSGSAAGATSKAGGSSKAGESSVAGGSGEEAGAPSTAGTGTGGGGGMGDAGATSEAGAGGEGGAAEETVAWYQCQATDQAFVRRAILGILGRHPYGQAEVNVYTDMISQIDAIDGYEPETKISEPITTLRHSRQVVVNALLENPEYQSNWAELYRDFVRVQRIEEQNNAACVALRVRTTDAKEVAAWVRDQSPLAGGDGKAAPTYADVVFGSIELDDMTPIYTEGLFTMVLKTYQGANALPVALELSRRSDFGAWFDGAYLNRDMVCLGCHNSEFSVTQSSDPEHNRHFPVPYLFEKALFGDSTGPGLVNGFDGADRLHGAMRRAQFLVGPSAMGSLTQDCVTATAAQITAATSPVPTCASGDPLLYCNFSSEIMCTSVANRTRRVQPWGLAAACGQFLTPDQVPIDQAFVETRLGNVNGYRTSMWDVAASLRAGFNKLHAEGLGADSDGNIADADKALSYLVSMTIVEKVWKEIVGTPLTIANYYPRNAAARDQLWTLTEAFIKSGYSNKALLSAIFASPYLNMAAPETGCGNNPYGAPRIFDPWRSAEPDESKRGNSISDGVQPISARTQARAAYGALGWPLVAYGSVFPNVANWGENSITVNGVSSGLAEFQFQTETGYYLKSAIPGFRGLDFQGRLGWEDRFAQCNKLVSNTAPDVIDGLVERAKVPGAATVGELISVLKDRIMGETKITDAAEKTMIEGLFGASLASDANAAVDLGSSLRKVCGAMITTPQFLLLGVEPKDGSEVPSATPAASSYQTLCSKVAALPLSDKLSVTCTDGQPLTVNVAP